MKYLLDVNALIAFGHNNHEFHDRVALWTERISPEVFTCSITELGFVRILSQVPQYDQTVAQARTLLLMLKSSTTLPLQFLADAHDISRLPAWVSGQTKLQMVIWPSWPARMAPSSQRWTPEFPAPT
jgi:predicted nucleic acid-binding protein